MQNPKQKIYNFLWKTQKYTGTDNVYLAKGGGWLTLSQIGTTIIALGLAIAWARFIPKEIYGQYSFILSIAGILAIFSLPGMGKAVTRATARGFEGTIKPGVKTQLHWSVLALLAGFSLAVYYWFYENPTLAISFLLVGVFSPVLNSLSTFNEYLLGKKRFDLHAQYSLTRTFLAAVATITAIVLTKNVIYLVLVYFAVNSLLRVFFYFLTLKKLPPNKNIDASALTFGKHLSLIGVLSRISTYIDKILIFYFLGAAEVAIYAFAVLLPDRIGGFTKILQQLALPKFSVRDEKEIKKTMRQKVIRLALFLMIIIPLYILMVELIFKLLFPAYMDSVFYSRIYIFSILGGIAILPNVTFYAKAKTKILYKFNIFSNLTKILILFISLYFFGLIGLVVGMVIHRLLSAAFNIFLLRYL